jgi:hypothetical protein
MSLYTHVLHGQESQAVNALPDFSVPKQTLRKTGTDDLGSDLQGLRGLARTPVDGGGQLPPNDEPETPFSSRE